MSPAGRLFNALALVWPFFSIGCQAKAETFVDVGVASGRCGTCHLPEYLGVRRPPHLGVKPTTCGVCHSLNSWHEPIVNHSWALTGAHAKADCYECHEGNPTVFQGTHSACVDCHREDYDKSTFPGHNRFPFTCADCHSTLAWKPSLHGAPVASAVPAVEAPPTQPSDSPRTKPAPSVASPRVARPPARPATPTTKPPDSVSGASRRHR